MSSAPPDPAGPKRRKSAAPPPAPPLLNYGHHVQHHVQFSARKGVVQCSGSKFKNRWKQARSTQNRALNSKIGGAGVGEVDLAPHRPAKVGLGQRQRNKCFCTTFRPRAPHRIVISVQSCVFSAHSDSSELKKVTWAPPTMTGSRGAGDSEGPASPMKWVQIDSARRVLSISIHFRSKSSCCTVGTTTWCSQVVRAPSTTSSTTSRGAGRGAGSKIDLRILPRDCGAWIEHRFLSLKMYGAPPKAQKKSSRDVVLRPSTTSAPP